MNILDIARPGTEGAVSTRVAARVKGLTRVQWAAIAAVACVLLAILTPLPRWLGLANIGGLITADRGDKLLTHTVAKTDLEITVLASGILESASTVEVLSEVEGRPSIISLLERGTRVQKGDVVVELDASALRTKLLEQRVLVQQAEAATAQAKEALQVAKSQAESDVRAAELALKFANLDLRKYLEGDYPQEQRVAESEITLAEEELKRANERIKYSLELKGLGYLSEGQVDADRLAVLRSEVKLRLAKERKQLLEQFTHTRMKQDYESKVEEAQRSLARSQSLTQASVDQAETKLKAQQSMRDLEQTKLEHLQDQIDKCSLRAPQDGVVLYPLPEDGDEGAVIKQGASVRQRQHVFTIPSTDTLQVSASVHEAVVHLVKRGQHARIRVDSFPDRQLEGTTKGVSSLPDLQSWRKSTVNFYPAKILIESDVEGLRPGMNAKVEIHIKSVKGVLAVPVQSVVQADGHKYCAEMDAGGQIQLREVKLGKCNDRMVEVKEGLTEGAQVVLSPDEVPLQLPEDVQEGA